MGPLATAYTLATLVMFAVCALARYLEDDADRVARAAAWLAFGVGVSRIISSVIDPPWSMIHYPAQDLFMLAMCMSWWQVRGEKWAVMLGLLFFVQLGLHAAFWWGHEPTLLRRYIELNNAAFIGQLLVLTAAGGRHVVLGVRRRLPVLRRWTGAHLAMARAS
jgi:hypothetical protein